MINNIHYVNNTCSDIRPVFQYFIEAYKTGELHKDISDLFIINIIKSYNDDGTDRMIIDAA